MAARRRRVKEVRDDIEVPSLNTRKVPTRDFIATHMIKKDAERNVPLQKDHEALMDIKEGLVEENFDEGYVFCQKFI